MSEYIKDSTEPSGWKNISYASAGVHAGNDNDGAPLTADGMDEAGGASDDGGEEG